MKPCIPAVVIALLASSSAFAAPLDSAHPLALVLNASVQKELAMKPEQVKAVESLLASAMDDATTKEATATVAKTLDKDQLERLKQISYQARGGVALTDPEVRMKVGLSRTQARKLAALAKDRELDLTMVLQVTRFKNAEAKRKFLLDWRKGAAKDMLAELDDEQKKAFEVIQGKKFDTTSIVK